MLNVTKDLADTYTNMFLFFPAMTAEADPCWPCLLQHRVKAQSKIHHISHCSDGVQVITYPYLLSPCYGNDRVSKPGNLWKGLLILTQRETTCLKPALTAWPGTFLQGETLTVIYSMLYWRGFVLVETSVPLRLEGTSAFAHSMGVGTD